MKIAAKTRPQGNDVVDVLMKRQEETEARIDMMRRQKNDEELDGCTFQPQIVTGSPYQEAYRIMNVWDEEQELNENMGNHNSFSLNTLKNTYHNNN